jgi:protein-disulfide isomerase
MGKARRTRKQIELERRRGRTRRMLIAVGGAVVLVVALVVIQQLTSSGTARPDPSKLAGVADVQAEFSGLTERAGVLGPPSSKVTIIEYGDLICPLCKQFDDNVVPQIIDTIVRSGQAKLEFRDWPIVGPSSLPAAQAAYAAQQQNRLWRYAALTYLNQGGESVAWFNSAIARSLAAGAGLDVARFDKDRKSAAATAYADKVNSEASALGFPGTPSIRVVGPKGSLTVDASYAAIKAGVQKVSGAAG